jgi:hypothetical protein
MRPSYEIGAHGAGLLAGRFICASDWLVKHPEKTPSKKRGRPANARGRVVGVRLQPSVLAALDQFIVDEGVGDSRPGTIRYILEDWFLSQGKLNYLGDPEDGNLTAAVA